MKNSKLFSFNNILLVICLIILYFCVKKSNKLELMEDLKEYYVSNYISDNKDFKNELLKNPEKLSKELFTTKSSFQEKMAERSVNWYKKGICPVWKYGKEKGKYYAYELTNKKVMYPLIKELGLPLPKRYYEGKFKNIIWKNMKKVCVVKITSGWSSIGVYIFDGDIEITTGQKVSFDDRKKFIINNFNKKKGKIKTEINSKKIDNTEWIIEEYLKDYDDKYGRARDFKCYVAGGKVWYISVTDRRNVVTQKHYTRNWLVDENQWVEFDVTKETIKRPSDLDKLIMYAEKIASNLDCFMRLDFYLTKRGPVFGEFTSTPHGGLMYKHGQIILSQLMELFPEKLN